MASAIIKMVLSLSFVATFFYAGKAEASLFPRNAQEDDAYQSFVNQEYVKARRLANEILTKDSESFWGNYVLANVFWHGEANMPRSKYIFKKTIDILDAIPESGDERLFRVNTKYEYCQILHEMDLNADFIACLETLEKEYGVDYKFQKLWSLTKLRRYEEAEAIVRQGMQMPSDSWEFQASCNVWMVIEDVRNHPLSSLRRGEESMALTGKTSRVINGNTGGAALVTLNFGKAAEYIQESIVAPLSDSYSNPRLRALTLYLVQGQFAKALSEIIKIRKKAKNSALMRARQEPEEKFSVALTYLYLGLVPEAYKEIDRIMEMPARQGYTSASREMFMLGSIMLYLPVAYAMLSQIDDELAAYGSSFMSMFNPLKWASEGEEVADKIVALRKERQVLRFSIVKWTEVGRKLASSVDSVKSLVLPLENNYPEFLYVLPRFLGNGVYRSFVEFEKNRMNAEDIENYIPYWALGELHATYQREGCGAFKEGYEKVDRRHLDKLPLLNKQFELMYAHCLRKEGNTEASETYYAKVLNAYPPAFRLLGIPLPVSVHVAAESEFGESVLSRILQSSLFDSDDNSPFRVIFDVNKDNKEELCLRDAGGYAYACVSSAEAETLRDYSEEQRHAQLIKLFLKRVWVPSIDMSSGDAESLDGSAVTVPADIAAERLIDLESPRRGKAPNIKKNNEELSNEALDNEAPKMKI